MSKHWFRNSAALLMAASLVSAPALATKDLTAKSSVGFAQAVPAGASIHGQARDAETAQRAQVSPKSATSSVPDPAGWLMMLAAFGLLGVATRPGTRHPLEQQQLA